MKLHYYPDTDSLYIQSSEEAGAETREVSDGVNVDIDAGTWSASTSIVLRAGSTFPPWRRSRYRFALTRSPELRAASLRRARTKPTATTG